LYGEDETFYDIQKYRFDTLSSTPQGTDKTIASITFKIGVTQITHSKIS